MTSRIVCPHCCADIPRRVLEVHHVLRHPDAVLRVDDITARDPVDNDPPGPVAISGGPVDKMPADPSVTQSSHGFRVDPSVDPSVATATQHTRNDAWNASGGDATTQERRT